MIHPTTIFRIIGSLLLLLAGIFVLFGIASPFLEGNDLFGFLASALATTLAGLWCLIIGKGTKGDFSRRDSYITITSCWIAFALFGSLPYWLGGHIPSFTDAFFESMSGSHSGWAVWVSCSSQLPYCPCSVSTRCSSLPPSPPESAIVRYTPAYP